jgi:hypothetical protein
MTTDIKTPFYLFGSENSTDYDVLVSVDAVPKNIDDAHNICKYWNDKLGKELLHGKPLNCNIGVFSDGILLDCFKGTTEELNNVLYYTYDNHTQYFDNPIKSPVERDVNEKVIRVLRYIISFYSRTHLRTEIKPALRGDALMKLEVLKKIDFTKMTEFPGKKEKIEDIYKVLAFQFGQVFSLLDGFESDSYTKNGILNNYPELSNMLMRGIITDEDLYTLNKSRDRLIQYVESNKSSMRLKESMI